MDIDLITGGRNNKTKRTDSKSDDVYFKLLVKLYRFPGKGNNIAAIVGTVTDDKRVHEIPALKVTALKFTETARARILKAGGECLTFDQFVLRAPLGQITNK